MKPKFILTALLFTGLSMAALAQKETKPLATTIHFQENFTSLSVNDDFTVVLTEGASMDIVIEGDPSAVAAKQTDGHLFLTARGRSATETKVYVPAALLSKIYLNGSAVLNSAATLSNHRLQIFMLAEAKIHVKSTGIVTVESSDEFQFVKGR